MLRLFNSIPFSIFTLIILVGIATMIYSLYDFYKNKPGHPMRFLAWELLLINLPVMWLSKYVQDFDVSDTLLEISEMTMMPNAILFFASFIVLFVLSYKKGYIEKEKYENVKYIWIVGGIFIACCIGYIYYLVNT